MKQPRVSLLFDRKKRSSPNKEGAITIEIYFDRSSRKFIETGIKVYPDQWDDKARIINRNDSSVLNANNKRTGCSDQ